MHPCSRHPYRPFLLFLLLLFSAASLATDEGVFIYNGFTDSYLTADGEAIVDTNGLLQLTGEKGQSTGHAFYPYPLNLQSFAITQNGSSTKSMPSFSTTFIFAIIGPYDPSCVNGHGLAFVLSSNNGFLNAQSGMWLGLPGHWDNHIFSPNHLVAVELDTVQNNEFNDIDDNHIGINVDSLNSIDSHTAGYYNSNGSFYPLRFDSRKPMQVWVDYNSKHTRLNVAIAPYDISSSKPSRPLLSVKYDLSTLLPTSTMYAGFSSGTGSICMSGFTKHCILGWSFVLNGEAAALNYSALSLKAIQELVQQMDRALPRNHKKKILYALLLPILTVTVIIVVAAILLVKVYTKRQLQTKKTELEWDSEYGPPSFTYKALLAATNGFKDRMLLETIDVEGWDCPKGVLSVSKQTVAIKRVAPESKQGMKEFIAEIVILGHLRHRNLVQLHGYCRHNQELLLVYDYTPNRSLDSYIHTQENTTDLCWAQRFYIIKGVASGLLYLHEEWEQVIIHRDIKTSNVLLDGAMNARLGDFGLARSHDHGAEAHTTHMASTWGYIAPELARLGKATKATDVFAFGVLMLEVVSGRRPIWVDADGEHLALADWVVAAWRCGSITSAIDLRLLDDHEEEELELVLKLGLLCSHPSPNVRPCMRLVMQYLQRDATFPAEFQPDSYLSMMSTELSQDEVPEDVQHAMSCPATTITDLSKGR
ncbi:hypothetical protein ACP4OV_014900 [Aristida adscensionis]